MKIAEADRQFYVVHHASAGEDHLAVETRGCIKHKLDTVQIAGKSGNDDAAIAVGTQQIVDRTDQGFFRLGEAVTLRVRRVRSKKQHAAPPQFSKR